ncbi:replication endonuclease [Pseudomonas sp. NY15463]|uniref:replication endonuclease n=1 Tax=Pseudomonas sp. NY15463 TaxID=3400361 RepID=UPI003A84C405
MNKNTLTTEPKTLHPEFKYFLKALSYFDDDELELLSTGNIPAPIALNRALNLKNATPGQISGVAKDLAHIHSLSVNRLTILETMGYISSEELVAQQKLLIDSMAILEEDNLWIPINFGLPLEKSLVRACDYRSIKKQLVKIANDERINTEAKRRRVGGKTDQPYCSDDTLTFRKTQEEISQKTLEGVYVSRVGSGQITTLADIAKGQEQRRFNQLFHISKNLQSVADDADFEGYFVTLTAPGNYHPNPALGKCSYDQARLRSGHEYIQDRWKLIRARLAKLKCSLSVDTFFGMRFVEAHKDGCAHWHLLFFTTPERFSIFQNLANEYFPARRQWDYEQVDRTRGEASSYLFKYVAKTVNSSKFEDARLLPDEEDESRLENDQASLKHVDRVTATLRAQRIRQFQCFGISNTLTKYRIINKIEESINEFVSDSVRQSLLACRMYNNGKKDKSDRNLIGFKNLITKFTDSFELIKEPYLNRFGEPSSRITGILFSCGFAYYLPEYEISRNLEDLLEEVQYWANDEELDQLERDTFITNTASDIDTSWDELFKEPETVTVIYSYPRPTASQLIDLIKHEQPKRFYVKYTDIQTKNEADPPLNTHEIIELLTT